MLKVLRGEVVTSVTAEGSTFGIRLWTDVGCHDYVDVDPDENIANALLMKLVGEQISEEQIHDILEDFVANSHDFSV